jgi:hypothetical protein
MTAVVATRWAMPVSVSVLIVAMVGTGFAAAILAAPFLWWVTPAMVCVILLGWMREPGFRDPDADPTELPSSARRAVRDTFAAARGSEALELLRAVVQPARSLFEAAPSNETLSPALLRDCSELVEASCATTAELARLENLLARDSAIASSSDRRALRDGVRSGSQLLRERLSDAASALGKLYVQSIERGSVSSERVAELARDLTAEVSVRRRANAELEALLR